MNRVTIQDIKQALWDKRFQDMFPEHAQQIKQFLKDPGCGCNIAFLRTLLKCKNRLKSYFPTKEVVEEDVKKVKNEWQVINCDVNDLAERIKAFPYGKRMVAASRFESKITVVLNDVDSIFAVAHSAEDIAKKSRENVMNWRVINTTIHELEQELCKLSSGRKAVQVCRFQDQVTAVINDLTSVF